MIITRTPTRLSLLGGGTDLNSWTDRHEGLVIGGAIDKFSYLSVRKMPPYHDYKTRVVYSAIESVAKNLDIQHKAVKACIEFCGLQEQGLEIFHASDIPGRSGIGSSSTFVVGLLRALHILNGKTILNEELANVSIHVEQNILQENVGRQDQVFAAYGGLRLIRFKKGEFSTFPLELNKRQVQDLQSHLMLFFTGISRTSSEISGTYTMNDKDMWTLLKITNDGLAALYADDYQKLGKLIDSSWRIKCGLSPLVSNEKIGRLYALATIHGAFGGKLCGAGAGGMLMLVSPPEKQESVCKVLEEEGCIHIPFEFEENGSVMIYGDHG